MSVAQAATVREPVSEGTQRVKDLPLDAQVLFYKRLARRFEGRYERLRALLDRAIGDFDAVEHRARWARDVE